MSLFDAFRQAGLIDLSADAPRPIPHFGDLEREYQSARDSAAFIPEHGFGMLMVTGADRAKFLHNFCTNDIKKMQPGDCCEAFFCNVKGRILALAVIICMPKAFLVLTEESRLEFLQQHLDRYIISEDVTLDADGLELLLVVSGDGGFQQELSKSKGVGVFPWDMGFQSAFWLIGPGSAIVPVVKIFLETGAMIAGHDAWELFRISAGYPRYGVDISDENLAQEANRTERAISFNKGCYLGQEPIARLDAMGHVNRQLERFTCRDAPPPPAGSPIVTQTGVEAGTVTSAQASPPGYDLSGMLLAMVKTKALGGPLAAQHADGQTVELKRE